jgi:hypothetical protein
MAEQLLDRAAVVPVLEQVRGHLRGYKDDAIEYTHLA